MAIPFTLAGIGSAALAQGISFLYAQAGELIKRFQSRKDKPEAAPAPQAPAQITIQVPAVFGGQQLTVAPDPAVVEARAQELLRLRSALSNYADNVQPVDPEDAQLTRTVDELRTTLETIFGQHLTFAGEDRPATGQPVVMSRVQVETVQGRVTGVDAQEVVSGRIESEVTAKDVESGGDVTGIRIGTHGQPARPPED